MGDYYVSARKRIILIFLSRVTAPFSYKDGVMTYWFHDPSDTEFDVYNKDKRYVFTDDLYRFSRYKGKMDDLLDESLLI